MKWNIFLLFIEWKYSYYCTQAWNSLFIYVLNFASLKYTSGKAGHHNSTH